MVTSGPPSRRSTPYFAKAWAAKGIPMAPFSEEAVGNVVDWPNTPGMNQALTDMGTAMGPIWLSGRRPSPIRSRHSKALTRPPTTTCKRPAHSSTKGF